MRALIKNKKIAWAVFILAAISPFVLRFLYPDTYHHYDVNTFAQWGLYHDNLSDLYLTECYCNYPYLGLLLSTGMIRFLGGSIFSFLIFLAIVDFINLSLIYAILRELKVKGAALFAGVIGLLPAIWVGGSLWGQIDTIGQTFLLIIVFIILRMIQRDSMRSIHLILIGVVFSMCILTKQLLLFPLFAIGVFLLVYVLRSGKKTRQKLGLIVLAGIGFILPLLLMDQLVSIPEEYKYSHLERVFLEGSDHMDEISGNGFNIWMLFYDDMGAPSTNKACLLSPKHWGLLLFAISTLLLIFQQIKCQLQRSLHREQRLYYFLLFFAIFNLCFNLFLTGTHERYLFHFFPFLGFAFLIAWKHKSLAKIDILLFLVGAIIYGLFVFGILKQYHKTHWFFEGYYAHRILVLFFLIQFTRLSYLYFKSLVSNEAELS